MNFGLMQTQLSRMITHAGSTAAQPTPYTFGSVSFAAVRVEATAKVLEYWTYQPGNADGAMVQLTASAAVFTAGFPDAGHVIDHVDGRTYRIIAARIGHQDIRLAHFLCAEYVR